MDREIPAAKLDREIPAAKVDRELAVPKGDRDLAPPTDSRALPPGKANIDDHFGPRRDDGKAAPKLDSDAARQRAREIASEGAGRRAILPFPMPAKPARKSKEAIAIEKALKPDCRNAYADMGLLAIAPLLWDAIREDGKCKW